MNQDNPFAPPVAPLNVPQGGDRLFFEVAPQKMFVMQMATFGIYGVYWMYMQWAALKTRLNHDIWPLARAIFAIFFFHNLGREVDQHAQRTGRAISWQSDVLAWSAVGALLFSNMIGNVLPGKTGFILTFVSFGFYAYSTMKIQATINAVNGDESGRSNASYSALNVVAIVFGGLLWLLILASLFILTEAELSEPGYDQSVPVEMPN
jgi:hypothetical protein